MTELDFTILAIIGRDGPLSAYDVRKVFAQSLTPTWSSSTGSVYPSMGRLEAAGLITASTPKGARSRKALSITAAGRAAIQLWLSTITPEIASATPDPIRTRMFFLTLVGPRQRSGLITSAIESTKAAIQEAERLRLARPLSKGLDLRLLASEGVLFELRARLDWLRWLQKKVSASSKVPHAD